MSLALIIWMNLLLAFPAQLLTKLACTVSVCLARINNFHLSSMTAMLRPCGHSGKQLQRKEILRSLVDKVRLRK